MNRPYGRLPVEALRENIAKTQMSLDALNICLQGSLGNTERAWTKNQRDQALRTVKALRDELERRPRFTIAEPHVTDHALVRFLDRGLNYDVDELRQRILTPGVRAAIMAGMTQIPLPEYGVVLAVSDGSVTTVLRAQG